MEESNPDLETFRQQWKEEVKARSRGQDAKAASSKAAPPNTKPLRRKSEASRPIAHEAPRDEEYEDDEGEIPEDSRHTASTRAEDIEGYGNKSTQREPKSALEHYEKAVEREAQGSLGDSLNHYRKAFKVFFQTHRQL
jgi:F-box protein 9